MKTCKYCGQENPDLSVTCNGCGKPLEALPPTQAAGHLNDPGLDPVIVATFENTEHAGVLKTRLEHAGIEAWIPEDCSIEFPPQTASVQVAAKDALTAQAIASEFRKLAKRGTAEEMPPERRVSNEETAGQTIPGHRACVSCEAAIPYDAVLCPKCGWTQPQVS